MIWTSLSQMDQIRANDRQDHHCATIAVFNLLDIGLLISKVCLATAKKQAYAPKGWKLLGYRWATVQATHVHQTRPKGGNKGLWLSKNLINSASFNALRMEKRKKEGASALSQQDQGAAKICSPWRQVSHISAIEASQVHALFYRHVKRVSRSNDHAQS